MHLSAVLELRRAGQLTKCLGLWSNSTVINNMGSKCDQNSTFLRKKAIQWKMWSRWLKSPNTDLCLNPAFIKSQGKGKIFLTSLLLRQFLVLYESFRRQKPEPQLEGSASAMLCPEFQLFLTFSPGKPSVPFSPLGPTLPFSPWKQSHLDKCYTGRMENRFLHLGSNFLALPPFYIHKGAEVCFCHKTHHFAQVQMGSFRDKNEVFRFSSLATCGVFSHEADPKTTA